MNKVSVVITVLNEESTLNKLLESLSCQTHLPDEVIIVDGGSSDRTMEIIRKFKARHIINISAYKERGNISHGRNFGINIAKNNIIALTDGGCVATKNWLKYLIEPLDGSDADVSAGFYIMKATTSFQKALSLFLGITPRMHDIKDFLPSARSMAFRKDVWKEVGKFREHLEGAGEDTLFNYHLSLRNYNIVRIKKALVYWEVPSSFGEAIRKFYWYAKGDAQTKIWWHPQKRFKTHNLKIMTIYLRYVFFFLLFYLGFKSSNLSLFFIVIFLYLYWSIYKLRKDIKYFSQLIFVPMIQICSDFSIMSGFFSGIISLWASKRSL